MPNSVKGFPKVYEYVVDVSLVLLVFLTQNSEVEDLFRGAASHSKACLFLCDDVFGLRVESVQDYQQELLSVDCEQRHIDLRRIIM